MTVEDGAWADAERTSEVVEDTISSIVAALAVGSAAAVLAGLNLLVVVLLALSCAATTGLVIGSAHWLGWTVGLAEGLWMPLLVGLSIGRPSHLAFAFTQATLPERKERVEQAVAGTWATVTTVRLSSLYIFLSASRLCI